MAKKRVQAAKKVPTASNTVHAAVDDWLRQWQSIPPLVRAGLAANLYTQSVAEQIDSQRLVVMFHEAGIHRRVAVNSNFAAAYALIAQLAKILTNDADAEATARGIDADTNDGIALAV